MRSLQQTPPTATHAAGRGVQTGCCGRRRIGRGSVTPGNGETRIQPAACISTEGGNYFRRAPERGWPKRPPMLHFPFIPHQEHHRSKAELPKALCIYGRHSQILQHCRAGKQNIKRRERSPKSTQSHPDSTGPAPFTGLPRGAE